ncbi:vWA domain-containing protein [Tropicibacter naphthalenivorans]|uniref:VWFA domain-containing protein n=1 Tax=Tropicibacter naphthalenivorans TaxID=441103 RepID=A0A0P1GEK1_9RHOB|nr:vWA domain-containing protein [Tropicibacter naphthalenivorans]CUH79876.1 hypothetical protein TRN7648_02691 [Tropicibacter naphthalenivorans]SMC75869.1 Ca-activated chloride channel family protein [Tropicibacter naphthalenivorans]
MFKYVVGAMLSFWAFAVSLVLILSGDFAPRLGLNILASAAHRVHEDDLRAVASANRIELTFQYLEAPEMRAALDNEVFSDVVWPMTSLWLPPEMRAQGVAVLHMPVVLGVAPDIAEDLGWTQREDILWSEISDAAQSGAFTLSMGATGRTDDGALAVLGALAAGWGDVLTPEGLANPTAQASARHLLAQVDRSVGRADWVAGAQTQAVIGFEGDILSAGRPLHIVYPADGLAVADAPFALIPGRGAEQAQAYAVLRDHLTSGALDARGYRTKPAMDAEIFTKNGARPKLPVDAIALPDPQVARDALTLAETELRKPALTVYLADMSKSVTPEAFEDQKEALKRMFEPAILRKHGMDVNARDVNIVIPYAENIDQPISAEGNRAINLDFAQDQISKAVQSDSVSRDAYYALYEAFEAMGHHASGATLSGFDPRIVVLTGGETLDNTKEALYAHMAQTPYASAVTIDVVAIEGEVPAALTTLAVSTGGTAHAAGLLRDRVMAARAGN